MSKGYGYRERAGGPGDMKAGQPADPRRRWPRKVGSTQKIGDTSGYSLSLLHFVTGDGNGVIEPVGPTWGSKPPGAYNGTATESPMAWDSAWKRHGYVCEIESTHPSFWGARKHWIEWNITAEMILDGVPAIIIMEDTVIARTEVTGAAGYEGFIFFGLTDDDQTAAAVPFDEMLGFYARWEDPDTSGNWWSISRAGGSTLRQKESALDCDSPHRLRMEIDGHLQQVRWYIDDVLHDTMDLSGGGAVSDHSVYDFGPHWDVRARHGATTRGMFLLDPGALISIRPTDL